jgi:hypothetical protein
MPAMKSPMETLKGKIMAVGVDEAGFQSDFFQALKLNIEYGMNLGWL